ncbi:ankyrin [Mollisia scopiformis]|uniref:Ankyrin n=1 Tax=Mollisia scopiformis TaxID=149040 RepID=A0A194WTM3_MOLSC|nr:ankyrin [Mollisia scopiformis]KUJ11305.1 ankyrin [Mollisia scopiformis]
MSSRHTKKHEKLFSCLLCPSKFGLKSDLDRHRPTHQQVQIKYKCPFPGCNSRGMARKDNLKQHIKKKHNSAARQTAEIKDPNEAQDTTQFLEANAHARNLELLEAVSVGEEERVRELILEGKSLALKSREALSAISIAVDKGQTRILEILMEEEDYWYYRRSFLSEAIGKHSVKMVKAILDGEIRAKEPLDLEQPLDQAILRGSAEIVRMILDATKEPPNYLGSVEAAIRSGSVEIVRMILDAIKEPLILQRSLAEAIRCGNAEILQLMLDTLERHGTLDLIGIESCIVRAALSGRVFVMRMLIQYCTKMHQENPLALLITEDVDAVLPVVFRPDNINRRFGDPGVTLLHLVVLRRPQLINLLLEGGFDINAKARFRSTPLSYTLRRFYYISVPNHDLVNNEVVKSLLDAGAKISPGDLASMPLDLRANYCKPSY